MGLIELLLYVGIAGFIAYLIVNFIPMPAPFKQVVLVIFVLALILFLVRVFIGDIPIGRVR